MHPVEDAVATAHEAIQDNALNTEVSMADTMMKAPFEAENANAEWEEIMIEKEEMNETHNMEGKKLHEERVEEIVA